MKHTTLILFAIAFPMLAVSWFLLKSSFYAVADILRYVRKEDKPVLQRIEPTF